MYSANRMIRAQGDGEWRDRSLRTSNTAEFAAANQLMIAVYGERTSSVEGIVEKAEEAS